ncbi:MAG: GTP-binding protein [Candidatus Tectimicrobiota bacterium]
MSPAARARDPLAGRLPISIITGFLGSGKSTLLGSLLRHPAMHRAAVIVNEFGEVGIDHALLTGSTESMTLLPNGCLCCSVRTDLQDTLRELFSKRRAGDIIDFDRVCIETTGLADPVPIIHALISDPMLTAHYRLDGVVTLVDAVQGRATLATMAEAVKQVAVADCLVITKTDLAPAADTAALRAQLQAINPQARQLEAVRGGLDPSALTGLGLPRAQIDEATLARWLGPVDAAGSAGRAGTAGGSLDRVHSAGINTFCVWFDVPFSWQSFSAIVQVLTSLRGPDLLRVKGLVHIAEAAGPVVVQGAQHLFHEPVTLAAWPGTDQRSRLVFITRGLTQEVVEALFRAIGAVAQPPGPADGDLAVSQA